jgi:hypothetical protein
MEDKEIKIEQQEEDNAEEQHPKQPPMKITKNRKGQKREYTFLETVKSVEELDNVRFEVHNLQ